VDSHEKVASKCNDREDTFLLCEFRCLMLFAKQLHELNKTIEGFPALLFKEETGV
jgi:hypothetical protein